MYHQVCSKNQPWRDASQHQRPTDNNLATMKTDFWVGSSHISSLGHRSYLCYWWPPSPPLLQLVFLLLTSSQQPPRRLSCWKGINSLIYCWSLEFSVFLHNYLPQRSWGKVMFLQASVILLTGGRFCLSAWWDTTPTPLEADTRSWEQTPPGADTPPPGTRHPHPSWEQTPPRSRHPTPPGCRHPPGAGPREQAPPSAEHAGIY